MNRSFFAALRVFPYQSNASELKRTLFKIQHGTSYCRPSASPAARSWRQDTSAYYGTAVSKTFSSKLTNTGLLVASILSVHDDDTSLALAVLEKHTVPALVRPDALRCHLGRKALVVRHSIRTYALEMRIRTIVHCTGIAGFAKETHVDGGCERSR